MKLATEEAAQVKAAEEAAIVVTQAEEALLLFEVSVLPPQLPSLPPLQSPERVSVAEKAIVDARPSFAPPSAAVAHECGHPPSPLAPGLPPLSAAAHHSQRRKVKQPLKRKVSAWMKKGDDSLD